MQKWRNYLHVWRSYKVNIENIIWDVEKCSALNDIKLLNSLARQLGFSFLNSKDNNDISSLLRDCTDFLHELNKIQFTPQYTEEGPAKENLKILQDDFFKYCSR